MEKAILSVNDEDLIVKYDHKTKMVELVGKGIDLKFKIHHFNLINNCIGSLESHAIQADWDAKYGGK